MELMKYAERKTWTISTKIYTTCLRDKRIQNDCNTARFILVHKKGSTKEIKNYIPISLLPIIYKMFTKIVKNRLQKQIICCPTKRALEAT